MIRGCLSRHPFLFGESEEGVFHVKRHEQEYEAFVSQVGRSVLVLGRFCDQGDPKGVVWDRITLRMTPDHEDGFFVVVKGHDEERELVAFYGGFRWEDVLYGLVRKALAGKLKWREDRPWSPGE